MRSSSIGAGRVAVLAEQEPAHLLVDLDPAAGSEHVLDGLGREDAPDRCGGRRRAAVVADAPHLLEHLVEAIGRTDRGEAPLDGGDRPAGTVESAARSATWGDTGGATAAASPISDSIRRATSQPISRSRPASRPSPSSACAEQLRCRALGQHRDGVGGGRDRVGTGARRLDGHGERGAARPLRVQADREPGGLAHAPDQLARGSRIERAGGVVQQDAVDAELGQAAGALDEPACRPERPSRRGRRTRCAPASRTAAIGPTRSSTSLSGSCRRKMSMPDSAAHRMKRRTRSASAGRGPTRNVPRSAITSGVRVRALSARMRSQGLSTAALDGAREAAAARDLERGVAGTVEILGEAQDARGRDPADERLLREQPDGGVDEAGHVRAQARDR